MVNFRTFLKRTGALMSVLVVLICCALPASAATITSTKVNPFPFDEVGILYGESFERSYRFPWIGNVFGSNNPSDYLTLFKSDSDVDSYSNFIQLVSASLTDDNMIRANYLINFDNTGWGIGFYNITGAVIEEALLSDGIGYDFFFHKGTVGVGGTASISCTVSKVDTSGSDYTITSRSYAASNIPFTASGGFSLFVELDELLSDYSYRPGEYVYLSNLSVRFFFDDMNLEELQLSIETTPRNGYSSFNSWLSQWELTRQIIVDPADPSGVNFVDWLQVAVGGFLDFEIWPGMSLNEIMWIILVAGVLFWFLKLTI